MEFCHNRGFSFITITFIAKILTRMCLYLMNECIKSNISPFMERGYLDKPYWILDYLVSSNFREDIERNCSFYQARLNDFLIFDRGICL